MRARSSSASNAGLKLRGRERTVAGRLLPANLAMNLRNMVKSSKKRGPIGTASARAIYRLRNAAAETEQRWFVGPGPLGRPHSSGRG
jgi:hypothetical protein